MSHGVPELQGEDIMKKSIRFGLSAVLLSAALAAQAGQFRVTWTNTGPQPLSPLFWSVGDASFDIFQFGGTSSAGIKAIAEGGNVAPMLGIAAAAGPALGSYGALTPGPLMPGLTRSAIINIDPGKDYFSFASMIGMTNDGFIGEGVSSMGLRAYNGTTALGFSVNIYGARAWDAGTEANTQSSADVPAFGGSGNPTDSNSLIRVHETIVPNRGDRWQDMPDWSTDTRLATITVLPVPEPATMTAVGLGVLALVRKRRTK